MLEAPDVVEGDDVRVRELGGGFCLVEEALLLEADVAPHPHGLERDGPPQLPIGRLVDDAEPAAPNLADELEATDDLPRTQDRERSLAVGDRRVEHLAQERGDRAGRDARRRAHLVVCRRTPQASRCYRNGAARVPGGGRTLCVTPAPPAPPALGTHSAIPLGRQ